MFKNLDTNDIVKTNFDFLHVVPPQTSPDFVAKSALAAGNGWVDVD
jgi:sulfide:quinone oxidoreductase